MPPQQDTAMPKQKLEHELAEAQKHIAHLKKSMALLKKDSGCALHGLVFENALGGMAVVSISGKILICNREAAELVGWTTTRMQGLDTANFYTDISNKKRLRKLLTSGKTVKDYELSLNRKDGGTIWINLNAKPIDYAGTKAALITFIDISSHRQALQKIKLDEIRFETLYTLSEMTDRPESKILDFAIEAITKVTSSKFGYIFLLNEDESELILHAWSKNVINACRVDDERSVYKIEETGLWGDAVRERKPIITNDYQNIDNKRGYPQGHIPISNHLNVPVFDEDRIIALAGVGNKPTDFDQEDVRQMELVMNGTWRIIQRKRANAALKAAHEELEGKVKRRTARLEKANETLTRYERIIATSPDLISLVDRKYIFRMVNESYLKLFNKKWEEIIGHSMKQLVGREIFERISKANIDKALAGETVAVESWIDLPTAGRRFMSMTYHPVSIQGNEIDYVSTEARDMTDLKQKEEAFQAVADRLALATTAGNIGIWEWDLVTDDLNWDNKMMELYRVEENEFNTVYDAWKTRLHPKDISRTEHELAQCIEKKTQFDSEFKIVHPDGSIHDIRAAALVQTDEQGNPRCMIGVNWDVTKQRKMEDDLRKLASTDPLTGASNRRHFMDRLADEFERCKRYGTSIVLLSLDIDHFKDINDTYGHPSGDVVLKSLVSLCKATLRTTDIFGRVGGEEFMAALTQTSIAAGKRTAERLRHRIEKEIIKTHGQKITFTISIGITEISPGDTTIETMLKRADEALYKAKNNGRNRCEVT